MNPDVLLLFSIKKLEDLGTTILIKKSDQEFEKMKAKDLKEVASHDQIENDDKTVDERDLSFTDIHCEDFSFDYDAVKNHQVKIFDFSIKEEGKRIVTIHIYFYKKENNYQFSYWEGEDESVQNFDMTMEGTTLLWQAIKKVDLLKQVYF